MKKLTAVISYTFLLLLSTALLNAPAISQEKSLLSDEIRGVIETKGVKAAKNRFAELYPSQQDQYEIDMQAMNTLGMGYMQSGNTEAALAVMEMAAIINQDMLTSQMNAQFGGLFTELEEQQRVKKERLEKERANKKRQQRAALAQSRGQARDDLGRFAGLYGDPASGDKMRRLWVMASCDGYLVSGALWGDASPWWMRSATDTVFTYSSSFQNLSMEFETGANGKALRMRHNTGLLTNPLERLEPIPDDWGSCVKRRE